MEGLNSTFRDVRRQKLGLARLFTTKPTSKVRLGYYNKAKYISAFLGRSMTLSLQLPWVGEKEGAPVLTLSLPLTWKVELTPLRLATGERIRFLVKQLSSVLAWDSSSIGQNPRKP